MIRRSRVRGFEFPLIAPQVVTWSVYLIVVGATYSLLLTTDVLSTKRLDLIVSIYSGMVGILAILFVWIETADPANCSLPLDESGLLQSLQERYPERCQFCSEHQGPRTKHCGHCNKCIHDFDHHCLYLNTCCLLYTSDAADEEDSVDLGGRRIIKKKKKKIKIRWR
eukprot:TRINITY_DN2706_c0_g1_i7.p1 TRINITY_DN2706_c0_g1~~TRINITY_DN2706_c0_g1_i7.p1  ORF type:complete len:167 (+),score=28.24 TRINITY_DN2706_c0_g1_i7:357-857(+)